MRDRQTFLDGWRAFWSSFQFIQQRGMKGWVLAFAIAAVLTWGCMAFGWWYSMSMVRDAILESPFLEAWKSEVSPPDGNLLSTIKNVLHIALSQGITSLLNLLFALITFLLNLKITKFIVLAVLGPLIAMLSERADAEFQVQLASTWRWESFTHGLVRGAKSASLMFMVEMSLGAVIGTGSFFISLLLPFLAPFLAILTPLAFVLIGSWFYGAAMFDCIWERQGLGSRDGLRATRKHGIAVTGLGLPLYLLMTIPLIAFPLGLILGPIGGAVGAVILTSES
jgi:uncharacterized protein involved in cysteine biosynthesis